MLKAFEFCIPTSGAKVPAGPEWLHEIKYDGYRLRLERDGKGVRLMTRGGYNFADRYQWIVEAARKVRQTHFVIDGEAVGLGPTSLSYWRGGLTASSLRRSSRARSGLTCFAPPAAWDWRDSSRSAATDPIRRAGRNIGSR